MDQELEAKIQGKKLVVWDMDGTLCSLDIDWPACREEARQFVKEKHGVDLDGVRVDQMEAFVLEKYGVVALRDMISLREKFESHGIKKAACNDDLVSLVRRLHGGGIKQAICSNNLLLTVESFLELQGLADCFEHNVGMDTTLKPKPNPEGLQLILDHFKISNLSEVLYVGDKDEIDGATARKLGIEYYNVVFS